MRALSLTCLFLATPSVNAGWFDENSTTTPAPPPGIALDELILPKSPFDVDEALANLTTVCLSQAQIEAFTGNVVKSFYADQLLFWVMPVIVKAIGLQELRTTLGMPPRKGPMVPPAGCGATIRRKDEKPSDQELEAAPTLEAYYELREPPIVDRFLRSFVSEANVVAGLSFVDAHLPVIRACFRQTLEQKRLSYDVIDRKVIDSMIGDCDAIMSKIDSATSKMVAIRRECKKFEC